MSMLENVVAIFVNTQVLILLALAFFFAVVLYILRKRVFPSYGPLELIIYFFGG